MLDSIKTENDEHVDVAPSADVNFVFATIQSDPDAEDPPRQRFHRFPSGRCWHMLLPSTGSFARPENWDSWDYFRIFKDFSGSLQDFQPFSVKWFLKTGFLGTIEEFLRISFVDFRGVLPLFSRNFRIVPGFLYSKVIFSVLPWSGTFEIPWGFSGFFFLGGGGGFSGFWKEQDLQKIFKKLVHAREYWTIWFFFRNSLRILQNCKKFEDFLRFDSLVNCRILHRFQVGWRWNKINIQLCTGSIRFDKIEIYGLLSGIKKWSCFD